VIYIAEIRSARKLDQTNTITIFYDYILICTMS